MLLKMAKREQFKMGNQALGKTGVGFILFKKGEQIPNDYNPSEPSIKKASL
jgi:hypothetical protein